MEGPGGPDLVSGGVMALPTLRNWPPRSNRFMELMASCRGQLFYHQAVNADLAALPGVVLYVAVALVLAWLAGARRKVEVQEVLHHCSALGSAVECRGRREGGAREQWGWLAGCDMRLTWLAVT